MPSFELIGDLLGALGPDVLGERPGAALLALAPENVAEARLALALRPGIHAVAEGAVAAFRRRDRPHRALGIVGEDVGENLEAGAAEGFAHVLHLDRIAQVRLVGAVFAQRVGIRDERKLRRHGLAVAEFLEHAADHRLDRVEYVLLRDEAHLEIELIEFAGRTVGARVLVAETGRDLEIAVEARHHDELLELLRRLRQRVEFSRMDARRHQIIARAFRRRRGQDRRLEFEEAARLHAGAQRVDDLAAQHDVGVQFLAPQVEEAVFEPGLFRIFLVAEHRHRQFGGGPQHLDLIDIDLDLAGRQFGVLGAGRALAQLAVDAHHPFRAQRLGQFERLAVRIGHDLREAVMVAQVDKQHAAVVADAMAPAGQADLFADVGFAQGAAGMGAITMHKVVRPAILCWL